MEKLLVDYPGEAVARITLNRPSARNALDHETLDLLTETMPKLDRGIEVRCVILAGKGKAFSAGYDIANVPKGDADDERDQFAEQTESLVAHPFHKALDAIANHPWPTVASIHGFALGGGLELALCCDLRVCASGAKLGMPPAKLGLIYGHTGLRRFIDTIGMPRTKQLFLVGDTVSSENAERMGLVHEVVDPDELEAETVELATQVAANAPISMQGNKRAIDTLMANPVLTPEQEKELVELRESCFVSEDFREGIVAFGEKRKPVWKGR